MKRNLCLIILMVFILATNVHAQAKGTQTLVFQNPFKPALPIKKETVIQPTTPSVVIKRRPTVTPPQPPKPKINPPEFSINGVIWNTDLPQAIVDNQIVGVGDRVNEAKILKINQSGIAVEYRGENFFIKK